MKNCYWTIATLALLPLGMGNTARAYTANPGRTDWAWDAPIVLHFDNHCTLLEKGETVESLTAKLKGIPVKRLQVSAFGQPGTGMTYPTNLIPRSDLEGWDTLGVWKQMATNLGVRFHVYLNTIASRYDDPGRKWSIINAQGEPVVQHHSHMCERPSLDGSGFFEKILLPMIREIVTRYHPLAIHCDGDFGCSQVCYCARCKAAWKQLTGKAEPPKDSKDPDWPRWLTLEQQRFDDYRHIIADTVHSIDPKCLYISNHSWKVTLRDPRTPPDWIDQISADYGFGGNAFNQNRATAMLNSGEDRIPCQIANSITATRKDRSLQRIMQEGALTMSAGCSWHVSPKLDDDDLARLRKLAGYIDARKPALGRTRSFNQMAVLVSETCWERQQCGGVRGYYDQQSVSNAALALQDAHYGTDIINEDLARLNAARYTAVVVPNQRSVAPGTLGALGAFVENGGTLLVIGSGLRGDGATESPEAEHLLGLSRTNENEGVAHLKVGAKDANTEGSWNLSAGAAKTLAQFSDGRAALTINSVGKGEVVYLAASQIPYPDGAGLLEWATRRAGVGPSVDIEGPAREAHLIFSLRQRPGQIALHAVDLTSRVKGAQVPPAQSNAIDDNPALNNVVLNVPLPAAPARVQIVPAQSRVAQSWSNGVLRLAIDNMQTHAAVLIDTAGSAPLPSLPPSAPLAYSPPYDLFACDEDFENLGGKWGSDTYKINKDPATQKLSVTIVQQSHADAGKSLKIACDASNKNFLSPFFRVVFPPCKNAMGHLAFDMMLEKNAMVHVELRKIENTAQGMGPGLTFTGGGTLVADKKGDLIRALPTDVWFHVELDYPLNDGKYDLRLTLPGGKEQSFKGLPYKSADWKECGWISFAGKGPDKTAFYLDNLKISHTPYK